jgi:hypothetical protein
MVQSSQFRVLSFELLSLLTAHHLRSNHAPHFSLITNSRQPRPKAAGHTKRESMAGRKVRAYRVSPSLSRQSFYVSRPKGRGYRMMPISHDSRFTAYDSPSLFHPRRYFSPYRFIPAPHFSLFTSQVASRYFLSFHHFRIFSTIHFSPFTIH